MEEWAYRSFINHYIQEFPHTKKLTALSPQTPSGKTTRDECVYEI